MAFKTDPHPNYRRRVRVELDVLVANNRTEAETIKDIEKHFDFYHPYLQCKVTHLERTGSSSELTDEPLPNAPDLDAEALALLGIDPVAVAKDEVESEEGEAPAAPTIVVPKKRADETPEERRERRRLRREARKQRQGK